MGLYGAKGPKNKIKIPFPDFVDTKGEGQKIGTGAGFLKTSP